MDQRLNCKSYNYKSIKGKYRGKLYDPELAKAFLDLTAITQATK